MAINFPSTSGQATDGSFTHTASGITWAWDGTTWKAEGVTSSYTLPTAAANTKGGVKIGSGLTMTNETLSADASAITVQEEGISLSTAATTLNFVGPNVTASGTGAHTLGSISFTGSTITSSGATVTVDDNLALSAGKTLTADVITSSQSFVDFGAKDVVTSGFFYTSAGGTGIVFEGTTADNFETLIQAVDPTADRTITIPNETGTLVTTGSSAAVTGSMIAADTVAEANMANDAIGQDQLKSVVTLQILNSGGTVVKTLFGAGA